MTKEELTRDGLMKALQDMGVTALDLYDELQRDPGAYAVRMSKANALRRLLTVYQSGLRVQLQALKKREQE